MNVVLGPLFEDINRLVFEAARNNRTIVHICLTFEELEQLRQECRERDFRDSFGGGPGDVPTTYCGYPIQMVVNEEDLRK